jgi:predicted Fe-S protein YdhL (DUF1289 family)
MALGLAEYKARKQAEEERREAASRPRVQRFALEKDGHSAIVRFAQEMDYDGKNFNEARGIGFVNVEHTCGADPKNGWKNRANCTIDSQGACYGCERVGDYAVEWEDRKNWKQKEKFYINVIAGPQREVKYTKPNGEEGTRYFTTDLDDDAKEGEVYLLEQGTFNGIYDDLANYFLTSKISKDTITTKSFKITRKGSGFNDTSYSIMPIEELPKDAKSLDDFELYNIKEDVLVEVPYAQQEAFYFKNISVGAPAAASSAPRESAPAGNRRL